MYSILILTATLAAGQDPSNVKPSAVKSPQGPEARKEARDLVLRSVGADAMAFTKHYSELGVAALQQCEPATGKKIVQLYNSGELSKISNSRAVLEAVRQNGEPCGAWLAEHHAQLNDPEASEVWCRSPLEFVFELKDIEQAAEELRASRKRFPPWVNTMTADWNSPYVIIIGVLVVLVLVIAIWKRRTAAA
jgi:hypothetical protein